ncbi:putative Outer membrane lipoprotein carrier protein LolA [uncultured delta proteobacterium]|uniref:Putative Outer membrane lipoprotein carrier protein LolA n=1 Tax=uncultured delta proteobacterium TaxID=34034 RepID=A0A212JFP4_9DELT|nr:putative Outer membrane lipoprotein carrier protein LolA [uncultured delta proteobacterium]
MRRVPFFPCGLPALALLAVLCAFPAPSFAADALAGLKERTASVMTLRSAFVQETAIPMFAQPMRSQGRFLFKRPDCLRWEFTSPMREGFALKGDTGVRWEDDGAVRTAFTAKSDPVAGVIARQLMAWITFDLASINREYTIETLGETPLVLRMIPLREDVRAVIASITITFSAEGPASLVAIQEARGGRTTIAFSDTVVNGPVDDGEFDPR